MSDQRIDWLRSDALPLSARSRLSLIVMTIASLAIFAIPLFLPLSASNSPHTLDAPILLAIVLPLSALLVVALLLDGSLDSRTLAMLGVLCAVNAALRPLGGGIGGIELVFFLLIVAGRVFGPAFGFLMGTTSIFVSALITAGIGPWLPFQMVISAWIGMGAGLLPKKVTGKAEIVMLAIYGIFAAYVFGLLMNLWFWPFMTGDPTGGTSAALSYLPDASVWENLRRFVLFDVTTSLAWDTGRAIINAGAIALVGPSICAVLRRANRRSVITETSCEAHHISQISH